MKPKFTMILSGLSLAAVLGCSSPRSKVALNHPPDPLSTEIQDARVLYGMGKLELAEQKLQKVMRADPSNLKARYYMDLVHESQIRNQTPKPRAFVQTIPQQPIY
jgi:hypothetical protein